MPTRPILFYDGQCPLCRKEIAHYQRLDRQQRVDWQDLFTPESNPEHYGLDRIQAMRVIHAVDRQGQLQTGVHAFMVIWRELPYYRHRQRDQSTASDSAAGLGLPPFCHLAFSISLQAGL